MASSMEREDEAVFQITVVASFIYMSVLFAAVLVPPRSLAASLIGWVSVAFGILVPLAASVAVVAFDPGPQLAYWGRGAATWHGPKGIHDFCEENFRYSSYVAEMFNVLSCGVYVSCSAIGIIHARRMAFVGLRKVVLFFIIGTIGVGSALFHATLLQWGQVLDEAPMMMYVFALLYCFVECEHKRHRFGIWFPMVVSCLWFVSVSLYLFYNIYLLFVVGFGIAVTLSILYGFYMMFDPRLSQVTSYGFYGGVFLMATAFAAWLIDELDCARAHWLHLHVYWHFGTALAAYAFALAFCSARADLAFEIPTALILTSPWGVLCRRREAWGVRFAPKECPMWTTCDAPEFLLPCVEVTEKHVGTSRSQSFSHKTSGIKRD